MLQRWLVVLIGLPLLLAALLLCPDWATVIVVCGIAAAAAYELLHTAGKKVPKCVYAATILAAVALEWVIYDEHTWQFYEGYQSMGMIRILCVPLVLLYVFAGRPLVHIFLDSPTGEAMDVGVQFLRIISPFYFLIAAKLVADGVLRGAGMMGRFMVATFSDLILRVVLALTLSQTALATTGIWLSWPIGWVIGMALSLAFYFTAKWRKAEVSPEKDENWV